MITFSYGGGKQSVAIITMILDGTLPRPDLIVIANTSREVSSTWEYMNEIVQPALKNIGMDVAVACHDLATVDLYASNGDILIPAFTNGGKGKLPTHCSNEWKQRVIKRWLKRIGIEETDVWLGISLDEAERMKPSGANWYRHVYPLIEIAPTSRSGCIERIKAFGWPEPNKSRCWMCPNQSPWEWRNMKRELPRDFAKAVELEERMRQSDSDLYLHKLGIPLPDAISKSEEQTDMFDGCDSGYCFV